MPSLGADMSEGTLVEWLVRPGDTVHRGDILAVVDTVKTAIDVEVFEEGEIERLLVEPGTTVPVGEPLALLRPLGASTVHEPAARPAAPTTKAPAPTDQAVSPVVRHRAKELGVELAAVAGTGPDRGVTRHDVELAATAVPVAPPPAPSPAPAAAAPARHARRVAASPAARRRAAALGVALAELTGTGPGGAVTLSDVEAAADAVPATPHPPTTAVGGTVAGPAPDRRAAAQAATAALMARSKRDIPHYYLQSSVDLDATRRWLTSHNSALAVGDRVVPAAVLLLATARAARTVPDVNGFYDAATGYAPQHRVDLGVALSVRGGGLVVATLCAADEMSVDVLMASLKDLTARVRSGRLRSSEMAAPTITVTNLGDQGADLVHGVIYPPQVALVGFGRIVDRPRAVDGMLTVRPTVVVTLAGDHRVSDGHRGSRFLAALDAALQTPEEL
jgi:pyruvate dehydrogenase E2 component (dihydrolipoamide acetyltransferase)